MVNTLEKAKADSITIANWAKSCETKEQFDNVERFVKTRYKFHITQSTESEINYWIGTMDGILIAIYNLKFAQ